MKRLPEMAQLVYTQLLQQCSIALPSQRGISFVTKTIHSKKYWYLELVVGSTKRQTSLGRDTPELRDRIKSQERLYETALPDLGAREKLVSMLLSGGGNAPNSVDGRVLEVLSQAGVFLAGGVLVGSHAFSVYGNMLGVAWDSASMRTQDLDIASKENYHVGILETAPDIGAVLLDSGMGFLEVPALNRKSPSTSFTIRGKHVGVDLLTPMKGKESNEPVYLSNLKSFAEPVRFLDYLLEETEIAVIPFRSGVLINIPAPARFALHKLVISQRRRATEALKSRKDIRQAADLLEVLLEDRPGDVWRALDAAQTMPAKFSKQLTTASRALPKNLAATVNRYVQKRAAPGPG